MPKTLFLLVALFFLCTPMDYILPHLGSATILMPLGGMICALCLLEILLVHNGRFRLQQDAWLLVWLVLLNLASFVWAQNISAAISHTLSFAMTAIMYVLLMTYDYDEEQIRKLELASFVGGILLAIYVFREVNLDLVFAGYRLDFDNIGGSNFSDPNGLCGRLMLPLFCAVKLFLRSKQLLWRAVSLFSIAAMGAVIMLTGSRSGLIGSITGLILIVLFGERKKKLGYTVLLLAGIVLVIIWAPRLLPEHIYTRIFSIEKYQEVTALEGDRLDIWGHVLVDLFPGSPIWGYGAGNSGIALSMIYGHVKAVHNSYLLVLVDLGLLGFIPWIIYAWKRIRQAVRLSRWTPFPMSVMTAVFCSSFVLDAIKEKYLWNAFFYVYLCYTVLTKTRQQSLRMEQEVE